MFILLVYLMETATFNCDSTNKYPHETRQRARCCRAHILSLGGNFKLLCVYCIYCVYCILNLNIYRKPQVKLQSKISNNKLLNNN